GAEPSAGSIGGWPRRRQSHERARDLRLEGQPCRGRVLLRRSLNASAHDQRRFLDRGVGELILAPPGYLTSPSTRSLKLKPFACVSCHVVRQEGEVSASLYNTYGN